MSEEQNGWDAARAQCRPCRGTGRVLSTLGGQEHELTCPWCSGSAQFIPGRDAQQSPAEHPAAEQAPAT